ncbi:MAG: hypothetical protein WEA10_03060 [Actinomycetota bacterium]
MTTTRHDGTHPSAAQPNGHETTDADGVVSGSEPTQSGTSDAGTDAPSDAAESHVCPVGFCPIGMAVNSAGQVKPEAIGHLLVAGRELLLAAKAVVEARSDEVDEAVTRFQKIDIG